MKKNERGFTLIELLIVVGMILSLAATVATLYVGGSVLVSGIKAGTEQCGTEFGIEPVLEGDWFCPETRGND